jgi:6-phosphogluconolactonase
MKTFFKTQILDDAHDTAACLATDLIRYCSEQMIFHENIYIALSGGSTPQILFSIIAADYSKALDWKRIHFFWVDERCVPFTSVESNFGVADRLLFSKIDIPEKNLHPIRGADDSLKEVVRYTDEILMHVPSVYKYPVFDVVILGMGNDRHTASIFPGQNYLFDTSSICSVSYHPQSGQKRITLTGNVINNAQEVVFLITGSAKAQQIKSIFEDSPEADDSPAKHIHPAHGGLSWYLDWDAAIYINGKI